MRPLTLPQPGPAARETEALKDSGTSLDIPLDEVCLFAWDAEEASQEEPWHNHGFPRAQSTVALSSPGNQLLAGGPVPCMEGGGKAWVAGPKRSMLRGAGVPGW